MIDWSEDDEDARAEWLGDAGAWRGASAAGEPDEEEGWRGEEHLRDWPEWDAGPEYHMWRRIAERDRDREDRG